MIYDILASNYGISRECHDKNQALLSLFVEKRVIGLRGGR
jgi:hypothetical protein